MIVEPGRHVEAFAKAGADIITIHLEACADAHEVIRQIHSCGCKAGVSIKPGTPIEVLEEYLDEVELILIMSVEPGFGGQKYIPESTERIRQTAELIRKSGREIELEVDGGVGAGNVELVLEAGANVIVAGSAVFKDPAKNAAEMMSILKSGIEYITQKRSAGKPVGRFLGLKGHHTAVIRSCSVHLTQTRYAQKACAEIRGNMEFSEQLKIYAETHFENRKNILRRLYPKSRQACLCAARKRPC